MYFIHYISSITTLQQKALGTGKNMFDKISNCANISIKHSSRSRSIRPLCMCHFSSNKLYVNRHVYNVTYGIPGIKLGSGCRLETGQPCIKVKKSASH